MIWLALALTLAAAGWVSSTESPEETLAVAPAPGRMPKVVRIANNKAAPRMPSFRPRQLIRTSPADIFPSDQPITDRLAADAAAAEPVMPALPFRYAGKLVEGPATTVFLTDDRRQNLLVQAGDIIAETWRIDDISRQQITLTYMPMQTAVILRTGEEN